MISTSIRIAVALALACSLVSCTEDPSDDGASGETDHAENVAALTGLLPADTRGVFAVDLAALLSGGSSEDVTALLDGDGGDPVFIDEPLAAIGTLAHDQRVDNALGISHIYSTGSFDLTTGSGTQTVVDCRGAALMCSDIVAGSEAPYTAQDLDASNRDAITWRVDVEVDLGNFGRADSASTFTATRAG